MAKGKCEGCSSCSCGEVKPTKLEMQIENEMEKTLESGPKNYKKVFNLLTKYFKK
jgi:hypothetical protein